MAATEAHYDVSPEFTNRSGHAQGPSLDDFSRKGETKQIIKSENTLPLKT